MSDAINFLVPGERPSPDRVLARMSEAGTCLLSGDTSDLAYMPVSGDTSNILPSNMVCLAKEIAVSMTYSYSYELPLWEKLVVEFSSPPQFKNYNECILEFVDTRGKDLIKIEASNFTAQTFIKTFESLSAAHVKGIEKIVYPEIKASMTWVQYQTYLMNVLAKKEKEKTIITKPDFASHVNHLGVVR